MPGIRYQPVRTQGVTVSEDAREPLDGDLYAAFLHLDFTPDQAEQLARAKADPAVVGYRVGDCGMPLDLAVAIYT